MKHIYLDRHNTIWNDYDGASRLRSQKDKDKKGRKQLSKPAKHYRDRLRQPRGEDTSATKFLCCFRKQSTDRLFSQAFTELVCTMKPTCSDFFETKNAKKTYPLQSNALSYLSQSKGDVSHQLSPRVDLPIPS